MRCFKIPWTLINAKPLIEIYSFVNLPKLSIWSIVQNGPRQTENLEQ